MEKEWKVGDIVSKDLYTSCAVFCNKNGTLHIEERDGQYVIVANASLPEPTLQEQVQAKEGEYGLNRVTRTALLALAELGATLDSTLLDRVHEIETLAAPLRTQEADDDAGTV